jgi:hypothetical protein
MPHKILVRTTGPKVDYLLSQQSGLSFEPTQESDIMCNISGFAHGIVEVFNLLGCCAASMGSLLQESMLVPSSRLKMPWPFWTTALQNIPD